MRVTFTGGNMPLVQRIPKRGFNNRWGKTVAVVNLSQIDEAFAAGEEVTLESLNAKNLARGRFDVLKVLGNGELKKKLKISAHRFSESAAEKIKAAGGEMILLPGPQPRWKIRTEPSGPASEEDWPKPQGLQRPVA